MDIFLQVLVETTISHCVWAHLEPWVMSRCEPYAGVTFDANGEEELYDLKNDPNEWTNLSGDPSLAKVKERLASIGVN